MLFTVFSQFESSPFEGLALGIEGAAEAVRGAARACADVGRAVLIGGAEEETVPAKAVRDQGTLEIGQTRGAAHVALARAVDVLEADIPDRAEAAGAGPGALGRGRARLALARPAVADGGDALGELLAGAGVEAGFAEEEEAGVRDEVAVAWGEGLAVEVVEARPPVGTADAHLVVAETEHDLSTVGIT